MSWGAALGDIGRAVRRIRARSGPDAIAMYVGTAAGFGVLHPIFAQGFMTGVGSRNMYSSATQDCANKFAVADHMYGFPFIQPFPDIERTECLIIVGANPVVSKWSFLQVSNPIERLRAIERRGGRLWVVDPRRTETARTAGTHVFIRPATDVFFYLSFLHELIVSGGIDEAQVARHTRGFDAVRALALRFPPERTAAATRIAPETLRAMVADHRRARGAVLYSSTGVNMGRHGALAFWLQEVINAASGNLDRGGGSLVGRGIFDFPGFAKRHGALTRRDRSRIGGFRAVNDAFPGGVLADEILTPGPGRVRALFVTGGNPLLTMAGAERLRAAFRDLELLVVLDIFQNETASEAHYVLPTTTPLERADLPFLFPLFLGMQSRPYLQATRAVAQPLGECRDEATIYMDLARAAGVSLFGSRVLQRSLEALAAGRDRLSRDGRHALPEELLLSTLLRATGHGSFDALVRERHGRPRPDHAPGDFLGHRVLTGDGRVDLAPPALLAEAAGLEAALARECSAPDTLRLITRRAVQSHNSWTHNHPRFVSGPRTTNYLYVHPDDAARLGLAEGALADVTSATATVRVPVALLADLMPGTVALPHGWGHQHARGLSTASQTTGVNVNLLAADGPDALERVSGMAHLTGLPVRLAPARGPLDPTSWSGIPPNPEPPPGVPDPEPRPAP
ncbi:MAG: molybdopterin-dependent oxidoreductase [Deltaproteobacteria bacterium]|nr:molybdopterin-dependent oxidoreductase [Deltaproteobacteria bacterium]